MCCYSVWSVHRQFKICWSHGTFLIIPFCNIHIHVQIAVPLIRPDKVFLQNNKISTTVN